MAKLVFQVVEERMGSRLELCKPLLFSFLLRLTNQYQSCQRIDELLKFDCFFSIHRYRGQAFCRYSNQNFTKQAA